MRDVAMAAVLLLGAVAALVEGRHLPFGTVAAPGPGFFPRALAAGLAGVVVLLLARAVVTGRAAATPAAMPGGRTRLAGVVVALFLFTAVVDHLGFVVATFLLMAALFRVVERHRWTIVVAESAAAAVVSHVVFKIWLGVRLPPGPWGF